MKRVILFSSLLKFSAGFMVLIAVLLWSGALNASEQLRIVTVQIPPFGMISEDGKNSGMLYEIGSLIAEEAGLSYTNTIYPFPRMKKELEDGRADFSIFIESKDHDYFVERVAPVIPMENVIIGLKGSNITSLESLHGKTVAAVRGAKYDEAFTADAAIAKYETNDYQQSITMAVKKRLDAMIGPAMGLLFTIKQMGYSKDMFDEPLVLNTKLTWVHYSRKAADPKKMEAVKAAVDRLTQKNAFADIVKKYIGN